MYTSKEGKGENEKPWMSFVYMHDVHYAWTESPPLLRGLRGLLKVYCMHIIIVQRHTIPVNVLCKNIMWANNIMMMYVKY